MADALVTGGAGFIGSHLAEALLARGRSVRVLDNLVNGRRENLPSGCEFIEGDILDAECCRRACDGCAVVYHLAALGSVPRSLADPLRSHRVNSEGTLQVLLAAREAGCKRVVYASSSSVYGSGHAMPLRESSACRPLSPYGVSKLAAERYALAFHACYGLETSVVRYFNVYGPRQKSDGPYAAVIPRFILALRNGQPPVIYGDGRQRRDFTYVTDAVAGTLLAAETPQAAGEVFNISGGRAVSVLELFQAARELTGRVRLAGTPAPPTDLEPRFEAARGGDARDSQADLSRAREVLGYSPKVGLEEGLRKTVSGF